MCMVKGVKGIIPLPAEHLKKPGGSIREHGLPQLFGANLQTAAN